MRLDRLLAQRAHVGEAHAVGRQHAGERMDEHARHAERVGDEARVLAARAAEAAQRVLGDVVAALHGDVLDRVGHVLDGDPAGSRRRSPRAVRDAPVCARDVVGERRELVAHDRRRRAARRRPGRTPAETSAGSSLPTITLQSVTVSGPPRRYAAGPGFAPADSGPTRKRAPSNVQIEPPPAATVWILIIGARSRTPATSVTNARSYSPAQCVTSVDVPPMSKPMIRSKPGEPRHLDRADDAARRPGQDRVLALERCASVSPPFDCMNCSRMPRRRARRSAPRSTRST